MSLFRSIIMSCALLSLSACTTTNFMLAKWKDVNAPSSAKSQGQFKIGKPYNIAGRTYFPEESYSYDETGIASWYGPGFHGGKTANGEKYNQLEMTAAHRTLQLPALVRVTNMENGRSVVVRVNDRGPFARGRIIDVSERAADLLKMKGPGTARVRVQVLAEESKILADMARKGQSTKGYELALNGLVGGKQLPTTTTASAVSAMEPSSGFIQTSGTVVQPRNVQTAALSAPAFPSRTVGMQPIIGTNPMVYEGPSVMPAASPTQTVYSPSGVPGHVTSSGRFYPDPVVKQFPVSPTSIYVQVGSFSNPENVQKARETLSAIGPVGVKKIQVGGEYYFRVQVGPVQSVDEADHLLSRVINGGFPEARIRVDQNSS